MAPVNSVIIKGEKLLDSTNAIPFFMMFELFPSISSIDISAEANHGSYCVPIFFFNT